MRVRWGLHEDMCWAYSRYVGWMVFRDSRWGLGEGWLVGENMCWVYGRYVRRMVDRDNVDRIRIICRVYGWWVE